MSPAIDIQPMTRCAIACAARFLADLRADMNGMPVCTVGEMREALLAAMERPEYEAYVAWIGGPAGVSPVGILGLNARYAVYAGGAFGQITELYVCPSSRCEGVGRVLVAHARGIAAARGWSALEVNLPSRETHPGTHDFYARQGAGSFGERTTLTIEEGTRG